MNSTRLASGARPLCDGIVAYPLKDMPWLDTPRPGVREQIVRKDNQTGDYLGIVAFSPMSETGLHQHLGTAFAFFISGSLHDYAGRVGVGNIGVNLAGATHEAVTFEGCVLVSRLEGPVAVPPSGIVMHAGASAREFRNEAPDTSPDITIELAAVPPLPTRFACVTRRMLFDYTPTPNDWRLSNLTLFPDCPPITVRHSARTDYFVIAGDLCVGDESVSGPAFVTIDAGAEATLASRFGCTYLAWAEGPACSVENDAWELYGFR